uniref:hypothetical protein n=1 Tax=Peptoniphilus grossensis TaxID=1465756 RepID=UPI002889EDB3|nr:hypothetical protein [Peptoniphilus grossensis]
MCNKENNKNNHEITDKNIEEVTNKDNNEITENGNSIESGIFKDDKFSEDGFNKYVNSVEKVENIKNDIKSIVNEGNANTDNLDLIRESRIVSESKQNYGNLNGILISILLAIGSFIFGLFLNDTSICFKSIILIIAVVIIGVIEYITFDQSNKKIEEKRAATYFWLETEMEKRIKESKDSEESEESEDSEDSKKQITTK